MTMIRPEVTIMSRLVSSVSLKTALTAIISITAWHYTDAGAIHANARQIDDQGKRLDFQREELGKKLSQEQYLADQRELHADLREIRVSVDQVKGLIIMKGQH